MTPATLRLEGGPVAAALDTDTRQRIHAVGSSGGPPTLASVHLGGESPFQFYLRRQRRAAEGLGIRFEEVALPDGATSADLRSTLRRLDEDPSVHGVLVEHPLPAPLDFRGAVDLLRPEKDVDGVGSTNLGRLLGPHPLQVPAVALASLAIARHYRLPVEEQPVAVIGRSETVGMPLAALLAGRSPGPSATVTIAHSRTPNLKLALAGARTIFSCVGRPGLLTRDVVPEGAAVVDVGLSSVPDASRPGGVRPAGDADPASLDGWAAALTPVPGGVGPVTVSELMHSTVESWERQRRDRGAGR